MRPRQAAGCAFEAGEMMWGDRWKLSALLPAALCPAVREKPGLVKKDIACRHRFSSSVL